MTFYANTKEDSGVDEGYLWPFMKEATKFDIKLGKGGWSASFKHIVGEDPLDFYKNILCQQKINDFIYQARCLGHICDVLKYCVIMSLHLRRFAFKGHCHKKNQECGDNPKQGVRGRGHTIHCQSIVVFVQTN